jgi:hypothetical protein
MNLCYIYNTEIVSSHREKLLSAFKQSVLININQDEIVPSEHNFYILELQNVNKTLSTKLMKIFESFNNPLLYFLIPKEHNLSLIQLAFLLHAKSIITPTQDIGKVILKIQKDFKTHIEKQECLILGEKLIHHHSYILFKERTLLFASEQFYIDFECSNLQEVEENICSKLDLDDLLSDKTSIKHRISSTLVENSTFFIKSILSNDENLISFEKHSDYEPKPIKTNYLSTRICFIELLKDKLLEKMMSGIELSLLSIKIELTTSSSNKLKEELFLKKFLHKLETILDTKIILAEYNANNYVALFENFSFEALQNKAKNFHLQISSFLNKKNSKYIVSLYVIKIQNDGLNPILQILDDVTQDIVNSELLLNNNITYINNFQENMNEKEIISYMLDSIFLNASNLKLLNIYNGMCINTSSQILKKTDTSIYVKVEHIQGAVMNIDKKTVLQSSILAKSISATVEHIDIKEGYAILKNFAILEYDPNERQHGRVTSSKLIPIAITLPGSTIKGEIIDISATSIAIKVKKTISLRNILNKEVGLTFYLDNKNRANEAQKMNERATVIDETENRDGFTKLVCLLIENNNNRDVLLEYIFNRQKNIIEDMKGLLNRI